MESLDNVKNKALSVGAAATIALGGIGGETAQANPQSAKPKGNGPAFIDGEPTSSSIFEHERPEGMSIEVDTQAGDQTELTQRPGSANGNGGTPAFGANGGTPADS